MKEKPKRILITGASGFIGSVLYEKLSQVGCDVWGICREEDANNSKIVSADLLSYESTYGAFLRIPHCQILIHTAALAHSEKKSRGSNYFHINTTITKNVVSVFEAQQPYFFLLSSVAVYGEEGKYGPVKITQELRPSTDYGMSKVHCEEILRHSRIQKYHILRMPPVFDEFHLKDIKKRVYFPGQSRIKMRIIPSPQYSFCHIETLSKTILELIGKENQEPSVMNVADPQFYNQESLIKQFPGIEAPFPSAFLAPLYYLLCLFPKTGYSARCFFWKLFKNSLYM